MIGKVSISGKTLLIAEDEQYLREPLVLEFQTLGCRVFEASNGVQALEIVKREKIDLVISDVRMPGGDGIDLVSNMKALPAPVPAVILMTDFSQLSLAQECDHGVGAVLTKPFDLDVLQMTVERLLCAQAALTAPPA